MFTRRRFWILLAIACLLAPLLRLWLGRLYQEEENYSLIDTTLYMGGSVAEPPPGTRAVLNLCEEGDSYDCDLEIWEPIHDGEPAPSVDWLRRMVDAIDRQQLNGNITFVHCRNGVSRSGLVVTAYFMGKNHWTRDEALAFIRSKRPNTRPNPAFMERLSEWERVLRENDGTHNSQNRAAKL